MFIWKNVLKRKLKLCTFYLNMQNFVIAGLTVYAIAENAELEKEKESNTMVC